MSKFVHLHSHSHYSLLNALPKIDEIIERAVEYDMPAVALTDNGNLYGAIEFYKTCQKKKIKPIIGIDAYMALRGRKDKQAGVDNRRTRLVLLAKDDAGYKNLIKLTTLAHMEGFYYKPRMDKEILAAHKDGLICISPSFSGDIAQAVKGHDLGKARELIKWYKDLFGEDFYIEITRHNEISGHENIMKDLVAIAREMNVPIVAAHDTYYLDPTDRAARETLLLVNTSGSDSAEKNFGDESEEDFSFISTARAEELFHDLPEALENTIKIADKCNLTIELGKWFFPNFILTNGLSYDEELKRLTYEGIPKRGIEVTDEVKKRIEYELEVIKNKGYAGYFLVVGDLLRYAHENKILTTIRGSVAGSIVTYLTGITNVDPIAYKLPFERFLNPERPSAPDIDMDYADNRRDEIIAYAKAKYGADKVAQIGTFGTMMARGAVRDTARAMGFPVAFADQIAKMIPMGAQGFPMTIERALKENPELKTFYDTNPDTKKIIDMAQKIEGCARHISVHAAGVVIAPRPLTDFVPLQFDPKGEEKIITQYDMHAVGEDGVGLLKFDFLGIKNLAILADAVSLVERLEGKKINIEKIPWDDAKTFEMLARGETTGLFQLNGDGMTKYLKDLKPSTIHDINAMVALYRPGPLESIPEYIERKHDPKKIRLLDPRMKDILSQSYGVITYQDDVMLIAIHLAGYSWLEADKLRKAMGKKIPKEMEAQKGKLREGLIAKGMSEKKADELWKLIEPFAAYGFNKAHAASYGRVAYQTAYMKANFPAIYMAAVLTADSGDVERIGETIVECKRMGIPVLPPSINKSMGNFTVVKVEGKPDEIRFGLTTIKNFGEGIATFIINEREKNGPFTSLTNFLERVHDRNLNKKSLEALVKAGAMDEFGERGMLLANTERILAYNKEHGSLGAREDSLFGGLASAQALHEIRLEKVPPAKAEDTLAWEKELLGLFISGHPLDKIKHILDKRNQSIKTFKETAKNGTVTMLGGVLESVKLIMTKNNEPMAFLTLADYTGNIEVVVFPRTFREYKDTLVQDACVAIEGKLSNRNDMPSIIADRVKKLTA